MGGGLPEYNSLGEAYINTSEEFKDALVVADYYMEINATGDSFISRMQHTVLYGSAIKKYTDTVCSETRAERISETPHTYIVSVAKAENREWEKYCSAWSKTKWVKTKK